MLSYSMGQPITHVPSSQRSSMLDYRLHFTIDSKDLTVTTLKEVDRYIKVESSY